MLFSKDLLIALAFTLLIGVLLFFYIKQRTSSVENKVDILFQLVQDEAAKQQIRHKQYAQAQQNSLMTGMTGGSPSNTQNTTIVNLDEDDENDNENTRKIQVSDGSSSYASSTTSEDEEDSDNENELESVDLEEDDDDDNETNSVSSQNNKNHIYDEFLQDVKKIQLNTSSSSIQQVSELEDNDSSDDESLTDSLSLDELEQEDINDTTNENDNENDINVIEELDVLEEDENQQEQEKEQQPINVVHLEEVVEEVETIDKDVLLKQQQDKMAQKLKTIQDINKLLMNETKPVTEDDTQSIQGSHTHGEYKKMPVNSLREMILERNIADKYELKGLKKNELISLLHTDDMNKQEPIHVHKVEMETENA